MPYLISITVRILNLMVPSGCECIAMCAYTIAHIQANIVIFCMRNAHLNSAFSREIIEKRYCKYANVTFLGTYSNAARWLGWRRKSFHVMHAEQSECIFNIDSLVVQLFEYVRVCIGLSRR